MEIKTTNEIINLTTFKKELLGNEEWVSVESLKQAISKLTLTGYRGNPEGYIRTSELLKELVNKLEE